MRNTGAKIYPHSALDPTHICGRDKAVKSRVCYVCGKENLSRRETGLTKKLLDKDVKRLYCLDCLAQYLEVDTESLLEKVEEFRAQGCMLF